MEEQPENQTEEEAKRWLPANYNVYLQVIRTQGPCDYIEGRKKTEILSKKGA